MRRLVWALLLAFAFAVPAQYSFDFGEPFGNLARILALLALLVAIPALLLGGRIRIPGVAEWLTLALFLCLCCSYFWTIDSSATLIRLRGDLQVMLPLWLVWEFAERPEDLRDLMRAYVAGSWVLAALTLANFASADLADQVRFVAEGQDPNDVARFLDLGLPMAALLNECDSPWPAKVLALGYLPLGLVAVVLTASRGGALAAVTALVGCALLLARRHRLVALAASVATPALAAGVWFFVPHTTLLRIATIPEQLSRGDLNQRLNIWQAGWHALVRAPFLGYGTGTFVSAAGLSPADTAHNTALTIAVEGGLVALILAAALVAWSARSLLAMPGGVRIGLATALIVWLLTSMVATVEQNRTTWLFLAMISIAGRFAAEDPSALHLCFSRSWPPDLRELAGDTA